MSDVEPPVVGPPAPARTKPPWNGFLCEKCGAGVIDFDYGRLSDCEHHKETITEAEAESRRATENSCRQRVKVADFAGNLRDLWVYADLGEYLELIGSSALGGTDIYRRDEVTLAADDTQAGDSPDYGRERLFQPLTQGKELLLSNGGWFRSNTTNWTAVRVAEAALGKPLFDKPPNKLDWRIQ